MVMRDEGVSENAGFVAADSHDRVATDTTTALVSGRWWVSGRDLRLDHVTSFGAFTHRFENVGEFGSASLVADTRQQSLRQSLVLSGWPGQHDVSGELVLNGQRVRREAPQPEDHFDPLLDREPIDQVTTGLAGNHAWSPVEGLSHESRVYLEGDDAFGFGWTGQTALAFELSDRLTLRTGISRTRRTPLAEERFYTFSHAAVGYEIVGNPELTPESLWSGRMGASWINRDETIGLEFESFAHRIHDHICFASLPSEPGEPTRITYTNAPEVRILGTNASLEFSDLPGGLTLRTSYAWLPINEKLEDDGFPLVFRATHSVRAELRGRWFENRLEGWLDVQGRSEMDVINASGLVELGAAPGFGVIGAGVSYDVSHDVEIRLRADNLADQTNALWGPKPGRSVMLSLQFRGGDGQGQ